MADITMCANPDCTIRKQCYRAQAGESYWQSWSIWEQDENGNCIAFVKVAENAND